MAGEASGTSAVLITGGARGIGRATALLAAEPDWSVAVNHVGNEWAAVDTAEEVERRGQHAFVVQGDVADENDVLRLFEATWKQFCGLDGVVINAGIVAPASPLADMGIERPKRMFDVNVSVRGTGRPAGQVDR